MGDVWVCMICYTPLMREQTWGAALAEHSSARASAHYVLGSWISEQAAPLTSHSHTPFSVFHHALQDDKAFHITADIPGVDKDRVDVSSPLQLLCIATIQQRLLMPAQLTWKQTCLRSSCFAIQICSMLHLSGLEVASLHVDSGACVAIPSCGPADRLCSILWFSCSSCYHLTLPLCRSAYSSAASVFSCSSGYHLTLLTAARCPAGQCGRRHAEDLCDKGGEGGGGPASGMGSRLWLDLWLGCTLCLVVGGLRARARGPMMAQAPRRAWGDMGEVMCMCCPAAASMPRPSPSAACPLVGVGGLEPGL